jgi:hypothetical protein
VKYTSSITLFHFVKHGAIFSLILVHLHQSIDKKPALPLP